MKKLLALLLAGIVIVLFVSCGNSSSTISNEAEKVTETETSSDYPQVIINGKETTIEDILNDYESNEVSAEKKYENKPIYLVDKITSIESGIIIRGLGHFDTVIKTENNFEIGGDFENITEFNKGDLVVVEGYLYNVSFVSVSFGTRFEIYDGINKHTATISHYN